MNPEIKSKWITALRSGKYIQCKASLRNTKDEYCCLGVLLKEMGAEPIHLGEEYAPELRYKGEYNGGIPNEQALGDAGLNRNEAWKLAQMNDDKGKTFSYIADYIERNL